MCEQLFPDCTKAVMSTLIGTAMATVTPSDTTVFSTVVAGLLVLVTHKLARQNVSWHAPMVLLAFVSLSLPPPPVLPAEGRGWICALTRAALAWLQLRHFIAVNLAHAAVVRASRLT